MKIFIHTPFLLKRAQPFFKNRLILTTILDQGTRAYIRHSYPEAEIDERGGNEAIVYIEGAGKTKEVEADIEDFMDCLLGEILSIPSA